MQLFKIGCHGNQTIHVVVVKSKFLLKQRSIKKFILVFILDYQTQFCLNFPITQKHLIYVPFSELILVAIVINK